MSIYRPKGSKVFVMDFMFHSQRIRETTGMTSKTRANEVFRETETIIEGRYGWHPQTGPPRTCSQQPPGSGNRQSN